MNDFKTFDNQTLKESAVLMYNHFLSSDYHNPIVDLFQNKATYNLEFSKFPL